MHDFIRCVAEASGGKILPVVVPRTMLYLSALGMEFFYKLFRPSKTPALSRRVVDVLTLSYEAKNFEEESRLGWSPATSFETGVRLTLKDLA
jgi:hypothetical protein